MKKLIFILFILWSSFSTAQTCAPVLNTVDTCMYGYARTYITWDLDTGCQINKYHSGTPYNVYSQNWYNPASSAYLMSHGYSPGDPFLNVDDYWFMLEMTDSSFTDTVFANEFVCISGCMDAAYDNYNPIANIPANCFAMPPPQDDCLDTNLTTITVAITPDQYEGETSWDVINQNDSILFSIDIGFYYGVGQGNTHDTSLCIPIGDTITFRIYDSYGDGLCGSCFGGTDGNVLVTDECGDTIFKLMPGDNLTFDMDSSELFVMKDCSWEPVIGCPNPGYLEFNPAADSINPAMCITPRVIGCMDTTMFNYNFTANVPTMEDSCTYTLKLTDGSGDGWLGAYVVVSQLGNVFGPYTNINSFNHNVSLNLQSNHPVTIRAYTQPSSTLTLDQVGFELVNPEGVTILSGGTNPWSDMIRIFPEKYITIPNCPTVCDPYVYGCMDTNAFNYNSLVNTSDTSCYYNPGCTDPQYLEFYTQGYTADYDDGSCHTMAQWGCIDSTMFNYDSTANIDNGGCVPVISGCMNSMAYNYNSLANTPDTCIWFTYGCTDPTMFNYDPNANTDDGSCTPYVFGCTDSTMFNFNPIANADNNTCVPYIYGCTDPSMLNFNSQANTEDFSCIPFIYGCTDSNSLNYDSLANTDNGSCITPVTGCMDQDAFNYNSQANVNDSMSCLYDADCITGPGIPYWLNDPCYAWVIDVDDYCCDNEWDEICQLTYDYCEGTWVGPLQSRVQTERKLLRVTDILGRVTKENTNQLLFYIYDDGTVVKQVIK